MSEAPSEPAWRVWIGYFGAVAPTAASVGLTPLMTTAAMGARHINEAQIGVAFSFDLLANALATIFLSTRIAHLSPRLLGVGGALLMLIGNVGGMIGTSYWPLILFFAIRGAGIGCIANAQSALAARVHSPQRLLGASMAIQMAMIIAAPVIAGRLLDHYGQFGVFGVYAAASLVALPLLLCAPGVRKDRPATAPPQVTLASFVALARSPFVIAGILAFLGLNAMWPFFVQIAALRGIPASHAGDLIAFVTIGAGLVGMTAAALPDRAVTPVTLGAIVLCGAAAACLPLAPTQILLIAALAAMAVTFVFMQNLFVVIGVRLDRTGGLNAGSGGVNALVSAATPALAGALIHTTGSYQSLALFSVIAVIGGFTMMRVAVRGLDAAPLSPA